MKIYTRTGDQGQTSLYGGNRRSKADLRIEAYGAVDELQANLGMLLAQLRALGDGYQTDCLTLEKIQTSCFVLCAELARLETKTERKDPVLDQKEIVRLETEIDRLEKTLPKLRSFILQGGCPAGAQAHIARSVCRRAERAVVRLAQEEPIAPYLGQYLNRLSDYLFVLARHINLQEKVPETTWEAD